MPVLKLTRRRNESVILRDKDTGTVITVTMSERNPYRPIGIVFDAPASIEIIRSELLGSCNAPKEKPCP